MTPLDALRRLAASDGTRVAIRVDAGPALTYADWERRSIAQAAGLRRAGVPAGERVALVFAPWDWTEYAVAYAAVRRAGAVAVPVAADLGAVEAGRILRATRVTAAVTATPGEPVAAAATGRTLTTSDLEVGGDGAVEAAGDDAAAATASGPGPAEILAVSRHLSPPLLVVRGAGEAAGGRWPAAGRSALVHAFPVGTVAGQDALLSALGANPLTVVALPALDTARIAELVRSGHVDACALHPAAARALLDSGAMPPAAAGSLALLVVAGDDMPDGLLGRLRDAFPAAAIEVVSPPAFAPPHRPGDAVATAPVAVSQEGMLWHECFAPGCQNLPGLARRYRGPLDVAALRRALDEILRRHDALRSGFEVRAGTPLQTIRAHEPLVLETHDLSGLVPVDREAEVARRVARAGSRPFDLVSDALFAPELLRLDAEDHVLVIRTHHTVFDDWSVGVFRRELAALYAAFAAGAGTPLPDLEVTFAGFSTRQRERLAGPDAAGAMEFWRGELADAPLVTQLPVGDPDLPPGAPQASPEPVTLDLPANLRDGVRSLARSEHVTVYMATLAAFGVLTARVTGQDDLLLTTVVANRNRAELEGLIGCFTKKVPLRLRLGGDPTFREVLARTRQAVLGAVAHQEPAFDGVLQDVLGAPAARHGLVPHAAVVFQGVTPERDLVLPEVDSVGLDTSARTARAHFASASDRGAAPAPGLPWGSGLQLGTFVILTLVDDRERLSFAARGAFHGP
ncbi:MAG TPA: condensation domain-containing protein, partial [Candidatus Dormibacteraeota bacterium]|nr:condensation domain-containing protein [Candidatus Dormibacteraeota bacterium]